jgi:uncharacterized protein (TIGR03435 family)
VKHIRVFATLALVSLAVESNIGQQSTTASSFDVVSIRQVDANTGRSDERSEVEITANGWRLNDEPLFAAIINAYTPTADDAAFYTLKQVQDLPDWAKDNRYVIDAKIEESDMAKWHDTHAQADLLHSMLRSMLAERCKLLIHREIKEAPIYLLSLEKDGPKFKEAVRGAPHPAAGAMPGGGEFRSSDGNGVMHFYGAPMKAIAGVLSNITGRTVQDATGLTGRYDVALKMPSMDSPIQTGSDTDSGLSVFSVVGDLGLKLVPAKGKVETLVIDHIERPSEN